MKKLLLPLVSLLLVSNYVAARPLDTIRKTGNLVLATDPPYKPFFYEENGALTGFEVELANEVARRLGVRPDWKYNKFNTLLIGLSQNRYDMVVASHGITPERLKAVNFSTPDYCSGGTILTNLSGPTTAANLTGKQLGVAVGTTYVQAAEALKGVTVKTFPDTTSALEALMAKRVDAILVDQFFAYKTQASPMGKGLKVGDRLTRERIGFAIQKNNTSLLLAVNTQMSKMLADGTYARLSQKYFGRDVRCK